MTEAEWLTCADPMPMLAFLEDRASDRKLRLFAVVCYRRIRRRLARELDGMVVDIAARHGCARSSLFRFAVGAARLLSEDDQERYPAEGACPADLDIVTVARYAQFSGDDVGAQTAAIRDIFGNPFRPVTVNPSWRTPPVLALARHIYADRAFGRLPVLADALQDAGCSQPAVLAHCRGAGPHVRGCWAVDLMLGKAQTPSARCCNLVPGCACRTN
ncbi:MAG: hypothetical protein JWO38_6523 [Gemmataceae bacterium]|nr:hypothetical protein [Gemmataceae bacterium]